MHHSEAAALIQEHAANTAWRTRVSDRYAGRSSAEYGQAAAAYTASRAALLAALTGEDPAAPADTFDDTLYQKCADCHLFVTRNDSYSDSTPEFPIAEYVHLHRGDVHDEALDATHEAKPSGTLHTLAWWEANGPYAMRARFDTTTHA